MFLAQTQRHTPTFPTVELLAESDAIEQTDLGDATELVADDGGVRRAVPLGDDVLSSFGEVPPRQVHLVGVGVDRVDGRVDNGTTRSE